MGTPSLSLIAFDTDHIKDYVFATGRLKEIRGASSRLDYLNRVETVQQAENLSAEYIERIYANGGSALFVVDTEKAEALGQAVQRLYRKCTGGGASITYAIQPLPDFGTKDVKTVEMEKELDLLRLRLQAAKQSPGVQNGLETVLDPQKESSAGRMILPSHPFLALCSSCGALYAEEPRPDPDDPANAQDLYCRVCLEKRDEDHRVKKSIPGIIRSIREQHGQTETLWGHILDVLTKQGYNLPDNPQRPNDFNEFRAFSQGKEYLGLIYADANGMGRKMEKLPILQQVHDFAEAVDNAVFEAMGYAIKEHLPTQRVKRGQKEVTMFPFDILLVGGDDIVIVVPAHKALQVAHTLAEQFEKLAREKLEKCQIKLNEPCSLSVGVVLAPIKYPFHLQRELADEALKAAKKPQSKESKEQARINFVVITGSTSLNYEKIYQEMHRKKVGSSKDEFYATQRPYTLSQFKQLLAHLKEGSGKRLGRTKLHQLREAILKMNRTTTILEALALLRNWKLEERKFIEELVNQQDIRTEQEKHSETLFPWYREANSGPETNGKSTSEKATVYRTPLLDFIELYDFVVQEKGGHTDDTHGSHSDTIYTRL